MFWSRIRLGIIGLALVFLMPGIGHSQTCFATGDIDGSGTVDREDITALMKSLYGTHLAIAEPWQADVNGDCIVDTADLNLMINCMYSGPGICNWSTQTCCNPVIILPPCCQNLTGNIDNDIYDRTDIADLTFLIDHLFINFPPLECPAEGNIDGDPAGIVDITDLSRLISHLFICFGCIPAPCAQ